MVQAQAESGAFAKPYARTAWRYLCDDPTLFRDGLLALFLRSVGDDRGGTCLLRFPGFPERTKTPHVLANRHRASLDVRHRSHAFLLGQSLPVGARDALGRRFG